MRLADGAAEEMEESRSSVLDGTEIRWGVACGIIII
jgi:hypothetical protein